MPAAAAAAAAADAAKLFPPSAVARMLEMDNFGRHVNSHRHSFRTKRAINSIQILPCCTLCFLLREQKWLTWCKLRPGYDAKYFAYHADFANEISYRFHLKRALLRKTFILTCEKFTHLVRPTVALQKETWGHKRGAISVLLWSTSATNFNAMRHSILFTCKCQVKALSRLNLQPLEQG